MRSGSENITRLELAILHCLACHGGDDPITGHYFSPVDVGELFNSVRRGVKFTFSVERFNGMCRGLRKAGLLRIIRRPLQSDAVVITSEGNVCLKTVEAEGKE